MMDRFGGVRRSLPLFLVLLALPLCAYAQSGHFPDIIVYPGGPTAHCTATYGGPANINVPDGLLPLGAASDFANVFWTVSYNGSIYILNGTCLNSAWPWEPIDSAGAGSPIPVACGAGGTTSSPPVKAINCMRGIDVAARSAKAFCFNAFGRFNASGGLVQVNSVNTGNVDTAVTPGNVLAVCGGIASGAWTSVKIQPGGGGSCGFKITPQVNAGAQGLAFSPHPPGRCTVEGNHVVTNLMESSFTDMLHFYYVQVDPQGQSTGNLTFKLWKKGNTGSTEDCSFSVGLTTNLATLHDSIRDGFNSGTCQSQVGAHARHRTFQETQSPFKSQYAQAIPDIVEIDNAGSKLEFVRISSDLASNSQPVVYAETSDTPQHVPILNPWGVALMVLALLISTFWLVRRQRLPNRA
jgi:hypothetical protein